MIRNIGIEARPPEKECNDPKCPWHGHLKLRGNIFTGRVVSTKASKTAVVEWDYVRFIKKYERFERRKSRVSAYLPSCIPAKEGDIVRIGETRPVSKTKRFVVFEIVKKGGGE